MRLRHPRNGETPGLDMSLRAGLVDIRLPGKGIQTPMAQGRSAIIIEWIRTCRLSLKKSLSAGLVDGAGHGHGAGTEPTQVSDTFLFSFSLFLLRDLTDLSSFSSSPGPRDFLLLLLLLLFLLLCLLLLLLDNPRHSPRMPLRPDLSDKLICGHWQRFPLQILLFFHLQTLLIYNLISIKITARLL